MADTIKQFDQIFQSCKNIFTRKLNDYGASWRIMRPASITDQIYIKAKRIRGIETTGSSMVDEGIQPELMGIVNYGIIGLIQLELGYADEVDIDNHKALALYDRFVEATRALLIAKNHDYDEAWRSMRMNSYTDFILTKIQRIKQIEDNDGRTEISEGIDANYMDIINYAVFGLIKISEQN